MSTPGQVEPLVTVATAFDLLGATCTQPALNLAAGQVQAECGWHIAPRVTAALDLNSDGSTDLVLPTLALHEVTVAQSRAANTDLVGWDFSTAGVLHRPGGWPRGPRAVHVEFVHGYDETPVELVALVAELARANAATAQRQPGSRDQTVTVGGITETRSWRESGPVTSTLEDFSHVLDRYTVRVPTT